MLCQYLKMLDEYVIIPSARKDVNVSRLAQSENPRVAALGFSLG